MLLTRVAFGAIIHFAFSRGLGRSQAREARHGGYMTDDVAACEADGSLSDGEIETIIVEVNDEVRAGELKRLGATLNRLLDREFSSDTAVEISDRIRGILHSNGRPKQEVRSMLNRFLDKMHKYYGIPTAG